MTQDANAVAEVPQDEPETVVEATETPTEETEADASPDVDVEEVAPETVEDKAARLELDTVAKQKAIDRKTAAYHALQKKHDEQRQEMDNMRQLVEKQTPTQEPVIDNFETHEEYVNALVDYRSKAAVAEQQQNMLAQQKQMQDQQLMNERISLRQEQEVEHMKTNPMYKAATNEVDSYIKGLEIAPDVQEAVLGQMYDGNVPALIDYFGSNTGENLDELGKISKMSAPRAAVEVYKLQQKLSTTPAKKETKPNVTPTKKPPTGNTGSKKALHKQDAKSVMDWVNS